MDRPRLIIAAGLAVGGCQAEPERLQTYGILQPVCVVFCQAALETADIEGDGSVAPAPINQSETRTKR